MLNTTIKIVNGETGEEIVRNMNVEELKQHAIDEANALARKTSFETKAIARQAVLDRLGLTKEEAQLILGGSN